MPGLEPVRETSALAAPSGERLPRILCAAMGLQFAVGGAVIPFVTLLLYDRGFAFSQISQVLSASAAALLVFPFVWGMLADRYVPLNRLFTALNLLAFAALAGLAVWRDFAGSLAAFAVFTACLNPMFSLINALSFHHLANPREQFGVLRAWGSVGWIVPFLPISLWMLWANQSRFEFVLWVGMALCLAMAALSFLLPHTPPGARRQWVGGPANGAYLPALRRLLRDPNYLVLLVSMFLVAGSYSLLLYYSPPFLHEMGVARPWIGPIQAIGVVAEIFFFRWQPALLRRCNYAALLLAGCLAITLRHLLYSVTDRVWLLCVSYVLAGAVIVFFHMVLSVLVNAMAALEVRATAQTLLVFCSSGLGPMVANWTAGRLAAHFGNSLRTVFLFAAGLSGLAALLVATRGRQLNRAGDAGLSRLATALATKCRLAPEND